VNSKEKEEKPVVQAGTTGRRATGMAGLDNILEGGFPTGTTILILGSPMSGMELMGRQFWEQEKGGTYLILDAEPDEGMVDARHLPPDRLATMMKGERVVIDSLSSLVKKYTIEIAIQFMTICSRDTRKRGSNIIFLCYRDVHEPMEMARLVRSVDIVLELFELVSGSDTVHIMSIKKNRGNRVPEEGIPYLITAKGLEPSTTRRVK
jgi:KaiC/GvpD/RAD55 family RecA-like ATPase